MIIEPFHCVLRCLSKYCFIEHTGTTESNLMALFYVMSRPFILLVVIRYKRSSGRKLGTQTLCASAVLIRLASLGKSTLFFLSVVTFICVFVILFPEERCWTLTQIPSSR